MWLERLSQREAGWKCTSLHTVSSGYSILFIDRAERVQEEKFITNIDLNPDGKNNEIHVGPIGYARFDAVQADAWS